MEYDGSKDEMFENAFEFSELHSIRNEQRFVDIISGETPDPRPDIEWLDFEDGKIHVFGREVEHPERGVAVMDVTENPYTYGLVEYFISEAEPEELENIGEKLGMNSVMAGERALHNSDFGGMLVISDIYSDVLDRYNFNIMNYGESTNIPPELYGDDFFLFEPGGEDSFGTFYIDEEEMPEDPRIAVLTGDEAALLYHLKDVSDNYIEDYEEETSRFSEGMETVLGYFED